MVSIKVKFRPSTSENREGTIYLQIIHERIVRQWYSEYKIFSDEWDTKKSILIISANSKRRSYLLALRERIKWDTEHLKRIATEFSSTKKIFTADDIIKEFIIRHQQQSFFNFMENTIIRLKELGKQRTSETYISALNSLRRFRQEEDIIFDGFDSDLMESYEAYLKERGLIPNSRSFHMRILRAVYNRAVEKEITQNRHPFRHVYTGVDKTAKRAIDLKTIKKIKELDLTSHPTVDYARDMFLISFYFRGMSFVDMAYLKKSDLSNGHITYRRRKTGQQLSIKWTVQMQLIINKYPQNQTEYLLPIITSSSATPYNQYRSKQFLINKCLKKVAKFIGLNISLTLYCSRHSWASIAKAKGIPIGIISDGLGHDSELTTQIYLSTLDTSAVDRANALIMNLI
ncbi:MAG: site-specific integrase [Muribaculaceae bacterium]|nr:site-specific integrase [Muribaculaceae bacterium]